jgi:hypothetical protein
VVNAALARVNGVYSEQVKILVINVGQTDQNRQMYCEFESTSIGGVTS